MKTIITVILSLLLASVSFAGQNVVIIFDDSGSMKENFNGQTRLAAAKKALTTVVNQMPNDTKIGVLALNKGWIFDYGIINKDQINNAVNNVNANGGTPLGRAMKTGADSLMNFRSKYPYDNYRLIVVTDGEASDNPDMVKATPEIVGRGLTLDVIGVGMPSTHTLAQFAKTYRNANDEAALTTAIKAALAETTVNSNAGDSDFDFIAGLDEGIAKTVAHSLSESSSLNHPIGTPKPEKKEAVVPSPGSAAPAVDASQGAIITQGQPESSGIGAAIVFGLAIAVVIIVGVCILIAKANS